jgi:Uma2 family endonuclease
MEAIQPPPRRWTVEEFHRAGEAGVFRPDERLELVDGEIRCMSPQNPPHATASVLAEAGVRSLSIADCHLRVQKPLTIDAQTEVEPDIAVVPGKARDYLQRHPSTALLVVEIADSSAAYDRLQKAELYARAAVPEYWVLIVPQRRLEVRRDPDPASVQYQTVLLVGENEEIAPLAAPASRIVVRDLLP